MIMDEVAKFTRLDKANALALLVVSLRGLPKELSIDAVPEMAENLLGLFQRLFPLKGQC
jgi:hypothetical protein